MLMVAGSQRVVTSSVFGPISNAALALGLFVVMLIVVRSRRPRSDAPPSRTLPPVSPVSPVSPAGVAASVRTDRDAPPAPGRDTTGTSPSAVGDDVGPVCGESSTGR